MQTLDNIGVTGKNQITVHLAHIICVRCWDWAGLGIMETPVEGCRMLHLTAHGSTISERIMRLDGGIVGRHSAGFLCLR